MKKEVNNKLAELNIGMKAMNQVGNKRIINVDINDLVSNKSNFYEINTEAVTRLAYTIKIAGKIISPIVAVQKGKEYVVLAGHKRLAAAKFLKWTDVPVLIGDEDGDDNEMITLIMANQHRELTAEEKKKQIEIMREILERRNVKDINKTIADLFGISERTVYRQASDNEDEPAEYLTKEQKDNKKKNKLLENLKKNMDLFNKDDLDYIKTLVESREKEL